MKKNKKLAILVCCMLVMVCAVGATLAWLTDQTQTVTNTFTASNIKITLEETDAADSDQDGLGDSKEYKMVPGDTLSKDPKVTVKAGSEDCWLFVEVTKTTNFDSYLTYAIRDGWKELAGHDGVYYREVAASDKDQPFYILSAGNGSYENGYVVVRDTVTKTMMDALEEDGATLPNITSLSLCLVLALLVTAAIGGTMAYFTDDDAKTNTFTVGNVDIHIDEWMADGDDEDTDWDEYEDQTLAPGKVTMNKLVETVNDGSEDAYIRTFVTCPKDMYDYLGLGFNKQDKVLTNNDGKNMYSLTSWKDVGTFTINGEETSVFLCEYKGKVASGESVLSLTSVWLYENVTNDIVTEFYLAEGAFKVEVASQAIQARNLTYDEAMAELGTIDQALMNKLFNK